jgi:hypothetical protein
VPPKFSRPPKQLPYNFILELEGAPCARFQEAGGLDAPHGVARTTLILRRGLAKGGLMAWRKQGNVPLRDGALAMLGTSGTVKGRWRFEGARIAKWVGPESGGRGAEVSLKIVELACEKIELE